jgi:hypothetical protein
MQATHCREAPSWTGRWFSPKVDRWWRVWACPDHLDGLTGLREFGGFRSGGGRSRWVDRRSDSLGGDGQPCFFGWGAGGHALLRGAGWFLRASWGDRGHHVDRRAGGNGAQPL